MTTNENRKTVDAFLAGLDPAKAQIAASLRLLILGTDTELRESIKWGTPVFSKIGDVCYIAEAGGHVNLGFFQGAHLAAAVSHLEGSGKGMRHVKVMSLADIQPELFMSWIREAVAFNEGHKTRSS